MMTFVDYQFQIQTTGKMMIGTDNSKTYLDLIKDFTPRRINSDYELDRTQKVIDTLLDQGTLTADERDYLHLLGLLVSEYEQVHYPIPDIYGVEMIKVLMQENNLQYSDLIPILGTEEIVKDLFNERVKLTREHIENLANFFNVPPAHFLPSY
jgi:HTH-type transcriptional regulator / antitoxin HigA